MENTWRLQGIGNVIGRHKKTTGLLKMEVEVPLPRAGENREVIGRYEGTTGLLKGEVEELLPRGRDYGGLGG